jgi:hypothetical protein
VTIFIGSAIGTLAGMTAMLAEKKDMKMRIPLDRFWRWEPLSVYFLVRNSSYGI